MFKGFKRNTTDALFSDIVRARKNYVCERCQRDFKNEKEIIDCSHFITRGNKRVRWNFDNASCICRGCHDYLGKHPYDHVKFMEKKLGIAGLQKLIVASQRQLTDFRIDEKAVRMGLKIEWVRMKTLEKENILGAR